MKYAGKLRFPANGQRLSTSCCPQLEFLEDRAQPGSLLFTGLGWSLLGSSLCVPNSGPLLSESALTELFSANTSQQRPSLALQACANADTGFAPDAAGSRWDLVSTPVLGSSGEAHASNAAATSVASAPSADGDGLAALATVAGRLTDPGAGAGGPLGPFCGSVTPADVTLNGSAAFAGPFIRLTDGGAGEAGSAFFTNQVDITTFTSTFFFQITPGTTPLADGMTFTIQNAGPTALGPGGGGLGYGPDQPGGPPGIAYSVAVKFDLWNNAGEGDNSTGMYRQGASPTVPAYDLTPSGVDLHSQHVFQVDVTYNTVALYVTITDTSPPGYSDQHVYPVNLVYEVGGPRAHVGFTGGTGGLTAIQDIQAWSFCN